jgi:hypothetical protein
MQRQLGWAPLLPHIAERVFSEAAIARRLRSRDLREVVSFCVLRGSAVPGRECQRNDKDDDRHMGIRPSGDVDTDFVAMMVPHHLGAIEMAQAELRYGRNEPLRRMAQEIIVSQLQEMTAMRLALGQPLPPSVPSPVQIPPAATNNSKYDNATRLVKEP